VVVRFAGKKVLLGVTPGTISRLAATRLDDEDAADRRSRSEP